MKEAMDDRDHIQNCADELRRLMYDYEVPAIILEFRRCIDEIASPHPESPRSPAHQEATHRIHISSPPSAARSHSDKRRQVSGDGFYIADTQSQSPHRLSPQVQPQGEKRRQVNGSLDFYVDDTPPDNHVPVPKSQ